MLHLEIINGDLSGHPPDSIGICGGANQPHDARSVNGEDGALVVCALQLQKGSVIICQQSTVGYGQLCAICTCQTRLVHPHFLINQLIRVLIESHDA